jgi:protoporphyrin/coproporphyrin ferrochelatase
MNEASSPPMDSTHRPSNHPPIASGRIGVLIVNLGTPDATDASSVRRYLKEFLSDHRVIEESGLLWKIILHGFILTFRPRTKRHDYEKIWNREKNESPLKTISRAQSQKLAIALAPLGSKVSVDWAMRYGNPSIASRLDAFARAGCDRMLIVPLYPQYAAATTATVCDEVFRCLMRMRWQPTVRVAPPYFADAVYIEALAISLKATLDDLGFRPEIILASYHGIPKDYFLKGDPYYCHCAKTTRLLCERLGFDQNRLMMTFQSRFGRAEWLKPYTIETVQQLAETGCKNLVVITPGFSADCLETLEEIAVENAAVFSEHGGENFAVVPCLNDSELGMRVIEALVARELKGWV